MEKKQRREAYTAQGESGGFWDRSEHLERLQVVQLIRVWHIGSRHQSGGKGSGMTFKASRTAIIRTLESRHLKIQGLTDVGINIQVGCHDIAVWDGRHAGIPFCKCSDWTNCPTWS